MASQMSIKGIFTNDSIHSVGVQMLALLGAAAAIFLMFDLWSPIPVALEEVSVLLLFTPLALYSRSKGTGKKKNAC